MSKEANKLKLLYLKQIFNDETDEETGLTMPQIIEHLAEYGIEAERKAIYRDIEKLREFGVDIEKRNTSPVTYGLKSRQFTAAELMLLADAVQSSRFLTKQKSDMLVRKIKDLASKNQDNDLTRHLHVEGRIRNQNESVYANLDTIQRALKSRKKVSFKYFKHDVNKKRKYQHNGEEYIKTPVYLIYSEDSYYCVIYEEKYDNFANYRLDRMTNIQILDEPAVRNEKIATFDAREYESRSFMMYGGESVQATLVVDEAIMSAIIDRFGPGVDVFPSEDPGKARITVRVMKSSTFYAWLTQFGTQIRIEKPLSLRKDYLKHLQSVADLYE